MELSWKYIFQEDVNYLLQLLKKKELILDFDTVR